jgi:hypothetical protein
MVRQDVEEAVDLLAGVGNASRSSRSPAARASVQCMSMQNTQPLICEARTLTSWRRPSSSSIASSSRTIAANSLGAVSSIAMRRARSVALMIASCRRVRGDDGRRGRRGWHRCIRQCAAAD